LSLTGRPIPITLLPNGRDAQHLARAAASAGGEIPDEDVAA
jgi:hypothetical protein